MPRGRSQGTDRPKSPGRQPKIAMSSTHLSRLFEKRRRARNLKPGQLARLAGCGNVPKSGARIRTFELSGNVTRTSREACRLGLLLANNRPACTGAAVLRTPPDGPEWRRSRADAGHVRRRRCLSSPWMCGRVLLPLQVASRVDHEFPVAGHLNHLFFLGLHSWSRGRGLDQEFDRHHLARLFSR